MGREVTIELLQVGCVRQRGALVGMNVRALVDIPVSVALIRHPERGFILFDTGYGTPVLNGGGALPLYRHLLGISLPDEARIDAQLKQRGIDANDLALIILSHGHADHVGGLADLPPRPMIWSRGTKHGFAAPGTLSRLRYGLFRSLLPTHTANAELLDDRPSIDLSGLLPGFESGFDILGDGSLIGIPLPGHAIGQFGVLCRMTGGRDVFLIADAAWIADNVTGAAAPHPILDLIAHDAQAYHRTLAALRHLHQQRPDIAIVPSHCRASARLMAASRPAERG
jgi:glyoxylase-like metal-dependent hydrolase (beta-lactamase superfamily II)